MAVSSDSGLCGGIHSTISRAVRADEAKEAGDLVVVGDKPKAQLSRSFPDRFKVTFGGVGKDVPTFAEASAIADEITKSAGDWDEVRLRSSFPLRPSGAAHEGSDDSSMLNSRCGGRADTEKGAHHLEQIPLSHLLRARNDHRRLRRGPPG